MNLHKGVGTQHDKLRQTLQMEKGDSSAANQPNLRISQNAFINFYRSYELTHPDLQAFALASHVAKLWAKMNDVEKSRFSHDALVKFREKQPDRKEVEASSSCSIDSERSDMGRLSLHVCQNAFSAPTINMETYTGAAAPPTTATAADANMANKPLSITQTIFKNLTANFFRTRPKAEGLVGASTDTLCSVIDVAGGVAPEAPPSGDTDSSHTCRRPVVLMAEKKTPEPARPPSPKPAPLVELTTQPTRTIYRRDAKTRARASLHKSIKDPYNRRNTDAIEEKKRQDRETAARARTATRDNYLRSRRDIPDRPAKVDKSRPAKSAGAKRMRHHLKRNESSLGGKSFREILAKLNKDIRQLKEKRKIYDSLCTRLKRRDAKVDAKGRSSKK